LSITERIPIGCRKVCSTKAFRLLGVADGASVLVVEDERAQRYVLGQYLAKEGFTVLEAEDGASALKILRRQSVDLAVVDIMMPGIDGLDLVRLLRKDSSAPVIMLTARGEEATRVAGLEAGADDYVVKPFSMPELVARVRAQLRRANGFGRSGEGVSSLQAGEVELHLDARTCTVGGRPVELSRREFDLLAVLMRRKGRALTREQLLEEAWGTTHVTEKTVDVHMARLRQKVGSRVHIRSLRGVGYRLED
jgi:DNA-binding response OmpR family regulator